MTTGKLEKEILLIIGQLEHTEFLQRDAVKVLDDAKRELFAYGTFPSIITYPCEDSEARSSYGGNLQKLQDKLKELFGDP